MVDRDCDKSLAETIASVLESNAFMFPDACPVDELDLPYETCLRAAMGFRGPAIGEIWLMLPCGACREVAANIRGVELEDLAGPADAEDALKELLNIICGRFLTAEYGLEPIFQLSIPSVEEISEEGWLEQLAVEDVLGFDIEGAPALAGIALSAVNLEHA